MRTLAVLVALLLAGIALARLTAPAPVQATAPSPEETPAATEALPSAAFELLLSGTAKRVSLAAGGDTADFENTAGPLTGKLGLGSDKPTIFLEVEWADAAAGHRFAKLRLEVPGEETREHVFSAAADIDDIWEP
ncbi:hypothetical protein OKA04_02510 [Luteolibacter flavescens]|uniref:Uncharacterized protein n=1 Tax=Luteolibacter flavescens TaxID=1859460 RepID=A0ABT3FJE9_9BACT|nr:hypothetical protein [Luteolibacter flavescens]MCW1883582.1 hypothetical protein [Luteolibacter flavescens]